MHLGKAIHSNNWAAVRKDFNNLPINGVNGESSEKEIFEILEKYGIVLDSESISVEIWRSGKPMREFLWSEDMADACVFILRSRDFKDT